MTQSKLKRSLQTRIVHAEDKLTPGFESFSMPVTRASTVVFPDLATMRALDWKNDAQWRYGLHATPTSLALAQRLATIEGGNHALCSLRDCRLFRTCTSGSSKRATTC